MLKNAKNFSLLLITLIIWGSYVFGETHISGDISEMQFDPSGNPYIVEQDILVPTNSKVSIKNGCVFLFKPFTTFTVQGKLIVDGTLESPVVFSSINDGKYNPASEQLPNPFDWNGIFVTRESSNVSLKNFTLGYSVYGIKSQNPNIEIENGIFFQNGQYHFTINDKIQPVQDRIPFTYKLNDTTTTVGGTDKQPSQRISNNKKILRYSSLGVGIGGIVIGGIFGASSVMIYSDWKNDNDENSFPMYQRKFNNSLAGTIAFSALGLLGFTGFTLTFIF